MSYTPTIGLEIHAELKTRTKMFCNSKNDPDETHPNVNVCSVCMGFPGTLPVVNKEAVKQVLRVGAALGGVLADYTEFDRKNYFYPDLPKGYQISQYQFPLVTKGSLRDISITRVHLEEDTARSQHGGEGWSLIDFNRSGIPLMELVTDPVIHDAKVASAFAQELQLLLRALGAGEANMEKGQMRVEANISVAKTDIAENRGRNADGTRKLGTKVEVKNLNSFKSVEKAIAYEIDRQIQALERGEKLVQETRGWDEVKEKTYSQRMKEDSHDYRYFPDPDIPKFHLSRIREFSLEEILDSLPELPWQRRERLIASGIDPKNAEVLVSDQLYASFYRDEIEPITDPKQKKVATNLLLTTIRGFNPTKEGLKNLAGALKEAAGMRVSGAINSSVAGAILEEAMQTGRNFTELVNEKGALQVSDSASLDALADEIIKENQTIAKDIKNGKIEAMKYLLGQGMKKTKGTVNPSELEQALQSKILS